MLHSSKSRVLRALLPFCEIVAVVWVLCVFERIAESWNPSTKTMYTKQLKGKSAFQLLYL